MKSKSVDKTTSGSRGSPGNSGTKKSKAMAKSSQVTPKRRGRKSMASLKSQNDEKLKKKSSMSSKSPVRDKKSALSTDDDEKTPAKSPGNRGNGTPKKITNVKNAKGTVKDTEKETKKMSKVLSAKTKVKNKKQLEIKARGRQKKKINDINQFIDIWSLASIGKREASLNATLKVNIMYERQSSPKKSSSTESSPIKSLPAANTSPDKSLISPKTSTKNNANASNKANGSSPVKNDKSTLAKRSLNKAKSIVSSPKKSVDKKSQSSNKKGNEDNSKRKRKSKYDIYEDEPAAKARKKENDKRSTKAKPKKVVKRRKKNVLDPNLGNIIERSPRQASLNAKAMIAMEQEEDIPMETAARTKVYDWTETRSCVVNDSRKMTWVTGNGDIKNLTQLKKQNRKSNGSDSTSLSNGEIDIVNSTDVVESGTHSMQNTLLKAIHETGDARLLKEFFRSQKEDFPGDVDIERCPTPEPPPPPKPAKEPSTPSPKKKSTPKSSEVKKTPEKPIKKPIVPSPTKPNPGRVATPIPQFSPGQQRTGHMTGFFHPPSAHAQSIYPNLGDQQQHIKQQPPPPPPQQPIKVTPYAPSSAYVYQCSSTNRQQQNLYVPSNSSPFATDTNNLVQRNYPSTFAFNQMGNLSFARRGLNPYQHHQNNAYNPSMHLPIQPLGFNFHQFYQPSIQQLHSQQNLPPSIQQVPLPAHQQYTLVHPPTGPPRPPPSVIQPAHSLNHPHLSPIRPYQPSTYPQQYPNANPIPSATEIKQDKSCMPPPPSCSIAAVAQPISQPLPLPQSIPQSIPQQQSPMTSIVQPLPSYRRAVPVIPQVQSQSHNNNKLIKPTPERLFSSTANGSSNSTTTTTASSSIASHSFQTLSQQQQPKQVFNQGGSSNMIVYNPRPIRPVAAVNAVFRPIACKKEVKSVQPNCDKVSTSAATSVESPKKSSVKGASEESSMSDILHSAHSTMFSVEEKTSANEYSSNFEKPSNQTAVSSTSSPSSKDCKDSRLTTILATSKSSENFNGAHSVSSILEMPTSKVKQEPKVKSCAVNADEKNKVTKKETYYLCIPPPKIGGKPGTSLLTTTAIPLKENLPFKLPEDLSVKQFPNSNKVIVIDDSDGSSDDEPLAKLVQSKPIEASNSKPLSSTDNSKNAENEVQKVKKVKNKSNALKIKLFEKKSQLKEAKQKGVKAKVNAKESRDGKKSIKKSPEQLKGKKLTGKKLMLSPLKTKQLKDKKMMNTQSKAKLSKDKSPKLKKKTDASASKTSTTKSAKEPAKKGKEGEITVNSNPESDAVVKADSISSATGATKKPGPKMVKKAPVPRKSKTQTLIPPAVPKTKAVHGWSWIGDSEWRMIPRLTQQKEEPLRLRKCYKSMKHEFGEILSVKDCVILQSDGDGSVPYVAKVSALWENLTGDMMFSMLWYYQPEHTATGREPEDGEVELFASKHREENSVACIDDKCYVLMYNEYCRMEANATRQELGLPTPRSHQVIPLLSKEDRTFLRPLPSPEVCMDNIWFCRYDYDTRKKITRKPKHKKTDLRYRGPCKLVQ